MSKINIQGHHFDFISGRDVLHEICYWRQAGQCRYISLVNPHSVWLARKDRQFDRAIKASSLILPDGIGIILAARLLGAGMVSRLAGLKITLNLCNWSRESNFRHYFYGGAEGVADKLAWRLNTGQELTT